MDFGKLEKNILDRVDFSLPEDGAQTGKTLANLSRHNNPDFYVGCAKWGRKEWVNLIYPSKTKEADFLSEYVKNFNSIELNALFYSMPKSKDVLKWKDQVEKNIRGKFLFCPKVTNIISHRKRLKDTKELTDQYLASVCEFGAFLGPCFLQLGDNFGPSNLSILEDFLSQLPADLDFFVEVRHSEWFSNQTLRKNYFSMLHKFGKGAIITDASGRRDCLHMELTIPEIFIRFVGNGSDHQASDFQRIDDWAIRKKKWLDHGLRKVFFFCIRVMRKTHQF